MLVRPRFVAALLALCCLPVAGTAIAASAHPLDLGLLATVSGTAGAAVEPHPDLFPRKVFDVSLDGKTTFSTVAEKLGAVAVRTIGGDKDAVRYACYRAGRGASAVVAIFTSASAGYPELVDGFAFGMQSAVPAAHKVCRQVPWLNPADLRFDKIWLEMPLDNLPEVLRGTEADKAGTHAIHWIDARPRPAADAGDVPAPRTTLAATFSDGRLVFFRVGYGAAR